MGKVAFSIIAVTTGVVIFTVICNASVNVPTAFLITFLFILHLAMIWMVIVILKHGKPSGRTFDERFYEDQKF